VFDALQLRPGEDHAFQPLGMSYLLESESGLNKGIPGGVQVEKTTQGVLLSVRPGQDLFSIQAPGPRRTLVKTWAHGAQVSPLFTGKTLC